MRKQQGAQGDLAMKFRRRDFLKLSGAAALSGGMLSAARAADSPSLYDIERFGDARILHLTDTHAQLLPAFFREPSVNIGIGDMAGKPPHLVAKAFLDHFGIRADSADAYAFTSIDFEKSAARFGRLGGFAHLKTLIDRLRGDAGEHNSVLLDGGDLWQGTGLANAMGGADMVEAANLLGIEAMTGHWEFTYGEEALRKNLARFKGEFLAQNVFLTDEAKFNDAKAFDPASGRVFKPSTIKEIGGFRVAVIGQAFPYVPIAHPKRFTPDWTFGIRDEELQKLVNTHREKDKVDAVLLLSHNGMDVDLKLASRVTGIDVILGGHTHDAVPAACRGQERERRHARHQCRLERKIPGRARPRSRQGQGQGLPLPAAAGLFGTAEAGSGDAGADRKAARDACDANGRTRSQPPTGCSIAATISGARSTRRSATPCAASSMPRSRCRRASAGAPPCSQASRSPWRMCWRKPRSPIRSTYVQEMTGGQIKDILEDVCDNIFNADPYYQQGGDMVRVGGLNLCLHADRKASASASRS